MKIKLSVDSKLRRKGMRKAFLVLLTVIFVMGLAISSGAAEKEKSGAPHDGMYKHEGGCGCGGEHPFMGMFKKLGLDKKQMAAVREIHLNTMKDVIKKKADIKIAKIELMEILSKDPVDMTAAESAVKKIEGLKTEMKMTLIKSMVEIKSNLNAEQKEKFSSMMRHMMMKREMMGHGMKGGMRGGECECQKHGMGHMHEKGQMKGEMKQQQN